MNAPNLIVKICHDYQKANNIKKQCSANSQYLFDSFKINFPKMESKVQAVFCFGKLDGKNYLANHLVVELDSVIYDASYETASLNNKRYFKTVKEVSDFLPIKLTRETISDFLGFVKVAERMNNGEILIGNKEFYNAQADYAQEQIIKMIK